MMQEFLKKFGLMLLRGIKRGALAMLSLYCTGVNIDAIIICFLMRFIISLVQDTIKIIFKHFDDEGGI